jgi:hypothetical protein
MEMARRIKIQWGDRVAKTKIRGNRILRFQYSRAVRLLFSADRKPIGNGTNTDQSQTKLHNTA